MQQATGQAVAALQRNLTCGHPGTEIRAALGILDHSVKAVELIDLMTRMEELERERARTKGRAVRDPALLQATLDAYRPLLARDRFPLVVLGITLPEADVDVNVHPTKAWVRFRHARLLHDVVHETARRALARVRAEIGKAVFGQERVIELTLSAVLAGGHVLLVGAPGLAKTPLCPGR